MKIFNFNKFNESKLGDLTFEEFKEILQDSIDNFYVVFKKSKEDTDGYIKPYYECWIDFGKNDGLDSDFNIIDENGINGSKLVSLLSKSMNSFSFKTDVDVGSVISLIEEVENYVFPRLLEFDNCRKCDFDINRGELYITVWLKKW